MEEPDVATQELRSLYFAPKREAPKPVQEEYPLKLNASEIRVLESGRAALVRARAGGDVLAWLTVADAITLLRSKIMQAIGSESPNGYRYNDAFGRWSRHLDLDMDKATRSRLLELARHWPAVAAWLHGLPPEKRHRLSNPEAILRAWRRTADPISSRPHVDLAALARELGALKARVRSANCLNCRQRSSKRRPREWRGRFCSAASWPSR
jgi:hypothetical protein